MMRTLICFLSGIIWLIGLSQCGFVSNQKPLSYEQRDSVLLSHLSAFREKNSQNINQTNQKIETILTHLKSLSPKPLDSTQKITLKIPACGGYSDSCRFESPHLTLFYIKQSLSQEIHEWYELGNTDLSSILNDFWKISANSYRPGYHQFEDVSQESVFKEMNQDFYNIQMLFSAKWLLVLDITNYQPPVNEFGGGSIKAQLHLFDFQQTTYTGSIALAAQNTPNFTPPTYRTKESTRIESKQRLSGTKIVTDRSVVKTTEKVENSTDARLYYAKQDLLKNLKFQREQAIKRYFVAENGRIILL